MHRVPRLKLNGEKVEGLLVVVGHVDPALEELLVALATAGELCGSNDGQPVHDLLLGDVGRLGVDVEVLVSGPRGTQA